MYSTNFESFMDRVFESTQIRTQKQLAEVLGVHRSAVSQAKKKNAVPESWIFKMASLFDINPVWLEKGVGSLFAKKDTAFRKIPVVKARLCARSGFFDTDAKNEDYIMFPASWLSRKGSPESMVLMRIFGNSMEPEFKDGDTILVDQSQKDILAGAVYAVGIDDTIMVKRIEKRPGQLAAGADE
ncbi:MAG: XRE family transcriptional regulator [Desulfobacteraceae bacterium]|jgi:phage repressor protein C with HTH and peptisase S24 domain|nr:XRE family transcriptional regulator [Desulfobacteraceae bacterium]